MGIKLSFPLNAFSKALEAFGEDFLRRNLFFRRNHLFKGRRVPKNLNSKKTFFGRDYNFFNTFQQLSWAITSNNKIGQF